MGGVKGEGDLTPPIGESAVVAAASPKNSQVPGWPGPAPPLSSCSHQGSAPCCWEGPPPGAGTSEGGEQGCAGACQCD